MIILFSAELNSEADKPESMQVIELTPEKYMEILFGDNPSTETWYVSFIAKKRLEPWLKDCALTVNWMSLLAEEFNSSISFAFIDAVNQEKMRETFLVDAIPNNFLFFNDTVLEHRWHFFSY